MLQVIDTLSRTVGLQAVEAENVYDEEKAWLSEAVAKLKCSLAGTKNTRRPQPRTGNKVQSSTSQDNLCGMGRVVRAYMSRTEAVANKIHFWAGNAEQEALHACLVGLVCQYFPEVWGS